MEKFVRQQYEYEYDERSRKKILGRGANGTVYAARELNTKIEIAVKEIQEKKIG